MIRPLACRETTIELLRVFAYPKFRLSEAERYALLSEFLPYTETITMSGKNKGVPQCRDSQDQIFFDLACQGKADYLVSGDGDILACKRKTGFRIASAAEFSSMLRSIPSWWKAFVKRTNMILNHSSIPRNDPHQTHTRIFPAQGHGPVHRYPKQVHAAEEQVPLPFTGTGVRRGRQYLSPLWKGEERVRVYVPSLRPGIRNRRAWAERTRRNPLLLFVLFALVLL